MPHISLTPERILEIRQARQKYGPANSWTGTTGNLATMLDELLKERERLIAELQCKCET